MNRRLGALLVSTAVALLVGYAAHWAVPYLTVLRGERPALVELRKSRGDCGSAGISAPSCRHAYRLSLDEGVFRQAGALTFGIVVPQYAVSCDGQGRSIADQSKVVESRNSIASLTFPQLQCARSVELSIWDAQYYRLSGIATAPSFLSSEAYAAAYAQLVDFFFRQFRLILLVFFAFSISISALSRHLRLPDLSPSFHDFFLLPWAAFLFVSSGMLAVLAGATISQGVYVHLNSTLSSIANLGPAVYVLLFAALGRRRALPGAIALTLSLPLALSGSWLGIYPWLGIACSLPAAWLTLRRKDLLASGYFGALVINYAKMEGGILVDPALLPHIHFSAVFLGTLYLTTAFQRVTLISRIFRINLLSNADDRPKQPSEHLEYLLKTIAAVLPGGSNELYLTISGSPMLGLLSVQRSGVSYSELPAQDAPTGILRTLAMSGTEGVSAVQLDPAQGTATIAMNDPSQWSAVYQLKLGRGQLTPENELDIRLCLEALSDLLWRSLSRYHLVRQTELNDRHREINELIRRSRSVRELLGVPSDYFGRFELRGFLGEVQSHTRKLQVLGSFGYDTETSQFLGRLNFTAEDDGATNAPLPIAMSQRRTMAYGDSDLIKPSLSEYSRHLLELAGTGSFLVIPHFLKEEGVERKFLLFLDSRRKHYFTAQRSSQFEYFFTCFALALLRIGQKESLQSVVHAVQKSLPDRVVACLKNGENPREEATGYLLCFDVIGSTALYRAVGEAEWSRLVDRISEALQRLCGGYQGASHDVVVWDAFFLTAGEQHEPETILELARAGYREILKLLRALPGDLGVVPDVRACITFGDITKDFSNGINRNWTIVGGAMARVCKFESSIKKQGPGIYVDPGAESIAAALGDAGSGPRGAFIAVGMSVPPGTERFAA